MTHAVRLPENIERAKHGDLIGEFDRLTGPNRLFGKAFPNKLRALCDLRQDDHTVNASSTTGTRFRTRSFGIPRGWAVGVPASGQISLAERISAFRENSHHPGCSISTPARYLLVPTESTSFGSRHTKEPVQALA